MTEKQYKKLIRNNPVFDCLVNEVDPIAYAVADWDDKTIITHLKMIQEKCDLLSSLPYKEQMLLIQQYYYAVSVASQFIFFMDHHEDILDDLKQSERGFRYEELDEELDNTLIKISNTEKKLKRCSRA